jgi:hypothetical protein
MYEEKSFEAVVSEYTIPGICTVAICYLWLKDYFGQKLITFK